MIKKFSFILVLSVLIIGCSTSNLPTPPDLDSSAPIGQAFAAVDGNAVDFYNLICRGKCSDLRVGPASIVADQVLEEGESSSLSFSLKTDALYETAYLVATTGELFPLEFEGISKAHPDSDLVNGPVYYTSETDLSKTFEFNEKNFFEGQNILLSFYCNDVEGNYECNDGKWVANTFDVEVGYPDLVLEVSVSPEEDYLSDDSIFVEAKIKNVGSADSGAFSWKFLIGEKVVEEGKIESLLVNGEKEISYSGKVSNVGDYILRIVVDETNEVKELDETNNGYEKSFFVKECFSGDTRCFIEPSGKVRDMIQKCTSDGVWDTRKLRADPCGPGEECNDGACLTDCEGESCSKVNDQQESLSINGKAFFNDNLDHPLLNAVDESAATYYMACNNPNTKYNRGWVEFDLGEEQNVGSIYFEFLNDFGRSDYPGAGPCQYSILTASENKVFSEKKISTCENKEQDSLTVPVEETIRYVKLDHSRINDGTGWCLTLYDFKVN
jgi:hypothetical protein